MTRKTRQSFLSLLIIFSSLYCSTSLSCVKIENFKELVSFVFTEQSEGYLKYARYASALLVAAYPLYYGCIGIKECIQDSQEEGYTIDEVEQMKTLETTIDISHLGSMVNEVAQELKISKQKLSNIRFNFYGKHKGGSNAFATSRTLGFYLSFFSLTKEEQAHILGHEFTHIIEYHKFIKDICSLLIPLGSYGVTQLYIKLLKHNFHNKNFELPTINNILMLTAIAPCLSFCISQIALNTITCYLEKRADLRAAQSFKYALGGVIAYNPYEVKDPTDVNKLNEIVEKKELNEEKNKSNFLLKKIPALETVNFFLESLYGLNAHPSNSKRFSYLAEKLVELEKQEYKKSL